jgi:Mn2+/Fe2+ NRAMP family transporter
MHREPHQRQRLRKLPPASGRFVTPFVLSVFMSGIVSAVVTVKGVGLGSEFLGNWPGAWGASWIIAFPSLLLILPIVRRIVNAIVEQPAG